MSIMQLKQLFKADMPDEEKVLIDVKSLYRLDELEGLRHKVLETVRFV